MEVIVDKVGRIAIPQALRDRLGFMPGTAVAITQSGDGLHLAPTGRTARLESRDGVLVAISDTQIDDGVVLSLVGSIRR